MLGNVFLAFVIVLGLAGCQREQPIYDVSNRPLLIASQGQGAAPEELRDAMIRTVTDAGWLVQEDSAGYLIAEQRWRTHSASVRIDYTADDFSIHYHDSENLLVGRVPDGMIHREYNLRVRKLEDQLAAALWKRKS